MNTTQIIEILMDRGYDLHSARLVAPELEKLCDPLNEMFEKWIKDKSVIVDFSSHGHSIASLMAMRHMEYPAALLTMDWIVKEPDIALRSLKKGIK